MTYPKIHNQERDRDLNRDPRAIDTRPSFDWMTALGLIAALVFILLLIGAFSTDESATNAPLDRSTAETPATPAPTPSTR
jgi:hypothetical protein